MNNCVSQAKPELYSTYMLEYLLENPQSTNFNCSFVYQLPLETDTARIVSAWKTLRETHMSLDCVFKKCCDAWVLEYRPDLASPVRYFKSTEAELQEDLLKAIQPFRPGESMLRLIFWDTEAFRYMFVDIYHALLDGTGINNLFSDFRKLLEGKTLPQDDYPALLRKRVGFDTADDRAYFRQKYGGIDWDTLPSPDHTEHGLTRRLSFPLESDIRCSNSHLLTGVLAAIAAYNGSKDVLATWTFHSRMSEDELCSTGLFIRDFPAALHIDGQSMNALFLDVKSQVKGAIAHMSYPYQMLEYNEKQIVYTSLQKDYPCLPSPEGMKCKAWMIPPQVQPAEDAFLILAEAGAHGRRLDVVYDSGMYEERSVRTFMSCVQENMRRITL